MRLIVGIDLGTTNTTLSLVDSESAKKEIKPFLIPQLSKTGELKKLTALPSCCYLASSFEMAPQEIDLDRPMSYCIGEKAVALGSERPDRLIASSKSWLCYGGAHREEAFLPLGLNDGSLKISPLAATTRILEHIVWAWKKEVSKGNISLELPELETIITIPASFGEGARRLTEQAACLAGLKNITLLEEPQAAFYSWLHDNKTNWKEILGENSLNLIVDCGGGTTDFSLIECGQEGLTRIAVGEHLLLGGDNMDLSLATFLEKEGNFLKAAIDSFLFQKLVRKVKEIKEEFMGLDPKEEYSLLLQGSSSSVIANTIKISLNTKEALSLLQNGFFKYVPLESIDVKSNSRQGLKTFGLPYEENPNLLFHLGLFLKTKLPSNKFPANILFNGGVFKSALTRNWVMEAIRAWYPHQSIKMLENRNYDQACSKGACSFSLSKKGEGVQIRAGLPKSYYLVLQQGKEKKALTLFSRGCSLNERFSFSEPFKVKPNEPVSFTLLSSSIRPIDTQGTFVDIDEESFTKVSDVRTFIRFGKGAVGSQPISVKLSAHLTALQTLDLCLDSEKTPHSWKLEFFLDAPTKIQSHYGRSETEGTFEEKEIEEAAQKLRKGFIEKPFKENVLEDIETLLQKKKGEFPTALFRNFAGELLALYNEKSVVSESKWWNLFGYFMRPGIGYPMDDQKINSFWKIYLKRFKDKKSDDVFLQELIALRRLSLGLNKGQQHQISIPLLARLLDKEGAIVTKNQNSYVIAELARTLSSFELLEPKVKIKLGRAFFKYMDENKKRDGASLYAIGRLGSRKLLSLSIENLIPKEEASEWVKKLLALESNRTEYYSALMQISQKGIREFDIDNDLYQKTSEYLQAKAPKELLSVSLDLELLGDSIPYGLEL